MPSNTFREKLSHSLYKKFNLIRQVKFSDLNRLRCTGTPPFIYSIFTKGDNFTWLPVPLCGQFVSSKIGSALNGKNCSKMSKFFPFRVDFHSEGSKKDNGKVASPESVSIHCKRCFYQNTDHYSVIICLRNTLGYRTAQDIFSLHKSYFYLIRTALLREFQDTFPE